MRKLLNTLYVTSENSYLSLDVENIVVLEDQGRQLPSYPVPIFSERFLQAR